MSTAKIKEILGLYLQSNGYRWLVFNADESPAVLTEYWKVESRQKFVFYIGFENWDEFESVGLSLTRPEVSEKNEWVETVLLNRTWKQQCIAFIRKIVEIEVANEL